jgi:hypothetical protein
MISFETLPLRKPYSICKDLEKIILVLSR